MRLLVWIAVVALVSCRQNDPVVAKVGSLTITQSEFRAKLGEVSQAYQSYVMTPNGRRQFLDILIREKLLLAAAAASEVRQSAEFKAEFERLKKEEEERLREGRDFLLTRLWLEDLRRKGIIAVSDDDAREYLRRHPTEVEARHALLATSAEAEAAARKARGGASFAALAKAVSLDAATAADGGRMPPALYGEIIPDLEDVVFRMRVGEIGGPIKSKFGYHVIKKEAERSVKFEAARERLLRLLEKQKLDRYLQSIQEKFPVEVVDEQFK